MLGIILGSLSTTLLCVNNIRDVNTDAHSGKRTLAVRISPNFVKGLFTFLLSSSYILNIYLFYLLSLSSISYILFLLLAFPCIHMIKAIYRFKGVELNILLQRVSIYMMIYSILLFISLIA